MFKRFFINLYRAALAWNDDNPSRMGAALAYYAVFSMAPLLLIIIATAGAFAGRSAVEGEVYVQLNDYFGSNAASFIQELIAATYKENQSFSASVIGIVLLFVGATGVFMQLQDGLNTIWKVEPTKESSILKLIKKYIWSMVMILTTGLLLLCSLVLSTGTSAVGTFLTAHFARLSILVELANIVVSFGMTTALFAMMLKFLPNVHIPWRNVWSGAAVTAGLFIIGKTLLGVYLGRVALASTYGAAASVVIILLWSYYTSQIFLFGAEFTKIVHTEKEPAPPPVSGYKPDFQKK